jgi:response regulator RpfG family c-di-GMP phosphodiesterase
MTTTLASDAGTQAPAAPAAAAWTVLCVDDEPNILSSLKRTLRGGLRVLTAGSGQQALEILQAEPVDMIISDMRMPGMDGAQLLEQAHQHWPQVIRILLTGYSDMTATVAAINRGRIFRYLNKPWDDAELQATVQQGLERLALERDKQRLEALTRQQNEQLTEMNATLERRVQERTADLSQAHDKLKRSYLTSIKVFSNLLEQRGERLAGHGRRVAEVARKIARAMERPEDEVQHIFVAGLLHDVGLIGVSDGMLAKPVSRYSADESTLYRNHAGMGEQSLMALDDLQPSALLIRSHHERFDGLGFPDRRAGTDIPLGARIIAVADAYDDLQTGHLAEVTVSAQEARTLMRRGRGTQFDPEVLDVFLHITEPHRAGAIAAQVVQTPALVPGMVLATDLISARGILMLTAGQQLTAALIQSIRNFERREGSTLDINVRPGWSPA